MQLNQNKTQSRSDCMHAPPSRLATNIKETTIIARAGLRCVGALVIDYAH